MTLCSKDVLYIDILPPKIWDPNSHVTSTAGRICSWFLGISRKMNFILWDYFSSRSLLESMKVIPDSWRSVMRFLNNSGYPSQWNSVLHEVGKYSSIKSTSQFSNIQNSFVKMNFFSLFQLGAVLGCGNGQFRSNV